MNAIASLFGKTQFQMPVIGSPVTDVEMVAREIQKWLRSERREMMITGHRYFVGKQDILKRERTAIGRDGQLENVHNLPNNRIVDNQYGKIVKQKINYLFGKEITFDTDNYEYEKALKRLFKNNLQRTLQALAQDSLNCGIAWLYVYLDSDGELSFRRLPSWECMPLWSDTEHTKLEQLVRVYEMDVLEHNIGGVVVEKTVVKVEIFTQNGISYWDYTDGKLLPDSDRDNVAYISAAQPLNWARFPVIAFKYNRDELPLISRVKSLQDSLNLVISDYQNNMQEDSRNTILVVRNYDGQNLAEFRHNLATFGAVKVSSGDGADGGVDTIRIDVSGENYNILLRLLKNSLIENAMGYDAKDDRLSTAPNQMNIQSMYADIDLDANGMEIEYQAAIDQMLWFVDVHFQNTGVGAFADADVKLTFNRDMIFNLNDNMNMLYQGGLKLSNETLISQVPFVDDVKQELDRVKKEQEEYALELGEQETTLDTARNDVRGRDTIANSGQ